MAMETARHVQDAPRRGGRPWREFECPKCGYRVTAIGAAPMPGELSAEEPRCPSCGERAAWRPEGGPR